MNKKLTLCLLLALKCGAQAQTTYPWSNVALGGAGAIVTGVYSLPGAANNVWIRTDVGGVYRYNPPVGQWTKDNQGSWTSLTNSFPVEWSEYFACDGFAVDPAISETIFYAGGLNHNRVGALLKSSNNGKDWRVTNVPANLLTAGTINGNGANRYAGERLAVSKNSKFLVYGSRLTGAWYSIDAGDNWKASDLKPSSEDLANPDYNGVQCVAFDPRTDGRVYCAVPLHGVYSSTNGGANWTPMAGTSSSPQRLKVASDGTVWCTTTYSVLRYANSQWTSLHPDAGSGGDYCGLAINPSNPDEIVVQQGSQTLPQCKLWHTVDAGKSWTPINYLQKHDSAKNQGPTLHTQETWSSHPLVNGYPYIYRFSPADLAFDPADSGPTALRGGQWYCPDINTPYTDWYQTEAGHEENVMFCLACPPQVGSTPIFELLEGSGDDPGLGWMYNTVGRFPNDAPPNSPASTSNIRCISFCERTPQNMLRVGGTHFGQDGLVVSKSSNGGANWTKIDGFPPDLLPMDVAVSSGLNSTNAVIACHRSHSQDDSGKTWLNPVAAGTPFLYTANFQTASKPGDWVAITSLPNTAATAATANFPAQVLAADCVSALNFYFLEMSTNTTDTSNVWVSKDGGQSFEKRATTLPQAKSQYSIKAQPGTSGSVWVSADDYLSYKNPLPPGSGLYRSTNYGGDFNRVITVTRALSFGFGVGESESAPPALYLYGKVTGDVRQGVFYSKDLGDHWQYIADSLNQLGDGPIVMEGSRQTSQRVFVATQGRGIFYSK